MRWQKLAAGRWLLCDLRSRYAAPRCTKAKKPAPNPLETTSMQRIPPASARDTPLVPPCPAAYKPPWGRPTPTRIISSTASTALPGRISSSATSASPAERQKRFRPAGRRWGKDNNRRPVCGILPGNPATAFGPSKRIRKRLADRQHDHRAGFSRPRIDGNRLRTRC